MSGSVDKNIEKIIVIEGEKRWHIKKPRYNPFQTGHGPMKSKKKYSRKKKHKSNDE